MKVMRPLNRFEVALDVLVVCVAFVSMIGCFAALAVILWSVVR